jgi:hypothetical protein
VKGDEPGLTIVQDLFGGRFFLSSKRHKLTGEVMDEETIFLLSRKRAGGGNKTNETKTGVSTIGRETKRK